MARSRSRARHVSKKSHRKSHRRASRKTQRGGGWGFSGPAFTPVSGMAPEASRALTDDCATLARPAPSVTPTGAWSQAGGACGSCAVMAPPIQQGGAWYNPASWFAPGVSGEQSVADADEGVPMMEASTTNLEANNPVAPEAKNENPVDETVPVAPAQAGGRRHRKQKKQRGGGGGTGGYGFVLNNTLGKVYGDLSVGACPSGQRGGGASLGDASIVSYPAGYGYAPASAMEVGNGTAHFLAQIPYGKQCMGGGARVTGRKHHRKSRKGHKGRGHRKSRKGHKGRK